MKQKIFIRWPAQVHKVLIGCLLTLLLALFLPQVSSAAEDTAESKLVRIGYYENEVFQEGAKEGAIKKGYAYEYYLKLLEYTGWHYEYVYGSFGELYEKLLRGEVDLLAGLAWKEDREAIIGYPKAAMGNETYSLLSHDQDRDITSDPASLQGRSIAVLDSAMVGITQAYLDEYGIDAEIRVFADYEDVCKAFDQHDVDLMTAEGDGAYSREHVRVLSTIGYSDYYLCVAKQRQDLLAELNLAQTLLSAEEPFFLPNLKNAYYSVSISSITLSERENAWLQAHDSLKVGYLEHYLPYSDTDKDGNVTGVLKELVPDILQSLGQTHLSVNYQGFDSYDQMVEAIRDGTIDVAFPVGGAPYFAEQEGMYQSSPVSSSTTEVVFNGDLTEHTYDHFAVNVKNRLQDYYIQYLFPEAKVTYYPNIEACLDAVLAGEVTCTTLNGLRVADILKNRRYRDLSYQHLTTDDHRYFGVGMGHEGLLKLLNRGINVVGNDYVQKNASRYTDMLYSYNAWDFINDHARTFAMVILGLALSVILFLIYHIRRARHQMKEVQTAKSALSETDEIIAEAGFGIWHVSQEAGKLPQMKGNAKMMELLGLPAKGNTPEEIYAYWHDRIVKEDLPSMEKSISEMLAGRLSECTYQWEHPQKGIIYVRSGGTINSSQRERHILRGYHCDVTDIVKEENEKKRALSEALMVAEHANRAKTNFLNNMSHDIRTPMNAIVGFTSLASTHLDNTELVRGYLEKISISSQHLLSLINDVLDMSRIESGKVTIEEVEVHLPDLIHDFKAMIQANMTSKNQNLYMDINNVVHEDIITDKLRLGQVLLNILSNAIKFTPVGGSIWFSLSELPCGEEGRTIFEFDIRDNGIGMSEEFQQSIFEAFTREKTSTVSGIQGTGLGMAITKNIVDMMGGTIQVRSAEGKGTQFTVDIPCRIGQSPIGPGPIPQLAGMRVLVTDDDTAQCLTISQMLRSIGMKPDWTNYGREAIIRTQEAIGQNDPFQVYIIDWQMPDQNGLETVRQIRNIAGDDVLIVILTAYDWADIEEDARSAGVSTFCQKPLFMSRLRQLLWDSIVLGQKEETPEAPITFTGKRILLVEDNELNQMIAMSIIEETGATVEVAGNGQEAVDMMTQAPGGYYDVILMDIQMPVMDGYEAARLIRAMEDEKKALVPIIAVTANAFEEDRKLALQVGMDAHLAKPYDIPKMLETLQDIFRKS